MRNLREITRTTPGTFTGTLEYGWIGTDEHPDHPGYSTVLADIEPLALLCGDLHVTAITITSITLAEMHTVTHGSYARDKITIALTTSSSTITAAARLFEDFDRLYTELRHQRLAARRGRRTANDDLPA